MSDTVNWAKQASEYLRQIARNGLYPSVPRGENTLYGTCYGNMASYYLGSVPYFHDDAVNFIKGSQCNSTGYFLGPELHNHFPDKSIKHSRSHLLNHLAVSAVLPLAQLGSLDLLPLKFAECWCSPERMRAWQKSIDWSQAWFEGNNILFVGQLLVYLRDVESHPAAGEALELWFDWLDHEVDPVTSLWGTNGHCGAAEGVYGGYHQLLVYWHENRPICNPKGLVDTVLSLRHADGGFNPNGNGGACEDVDCVDILVNCYKRWDYRRAEIRRALWHCADHILGMQNPDGGFPYNKDQNQSHMGIPGTEAGPNASCTFPTWFRIHTLALCHEIIPEHPRLAGISFRFNNVLSMGWHSSPAGWILNVSDIQKLEEEAVEAQMREQIRRHRIRVRINVFLDIARFAKRTLRGIARSIFNQLRLR
jgi:hypothetical protein